MDYMGDNALMERDRHAHVAFRADPAKGPSSGIPAAQIDQSGDKFFLRNFPILRTGTFTDMFGREETYSSEDMHLFVAHFDSLMSSRTLPDIPVRDDHFGSTVGWFESLSTDGVILRADLEITEPDAQDKILRGTFRSRSSEVGHYMSNSEVLYSPIIFGLAFVDIPAVEGLFSSMKGNIMNGTTLPPDSPLATGQGGAANGDPNGQTSGAGANGPSVQTGSGPVGGGSTLAANTGPTTNPGGLTPNVPANGPGTSGQMGSFLGQGEIQSAPAGQAPQPTPAVTGQPNVVMASEGQGITHFSHNGETISVADVMQQLAIGREFEKETRLAHRANFVEGIFSANKALPAQRDDYEAFVADLDAKQFQAFSKIMEDAPAQGLMQNYAGDYGSSANGSFGAPEGDTTTEDPLAVAKGVVHQSLLGNNPRSGIKNGASFKKLIASGMTEDQIFNL